MVRYANRYPDGVVGLALAVLRVFYAFVAVGVAQALPALPVSTNLMYAAAGLVAACLVFGIGTRWMAAGLGLAVIVAGASSDLMLQLLLAGLLGGSIAMVLLGPGAYSIDARRYGRRVIELQTPERGAKD